MILRLIDAIGDVFVARREMAKPDVGTVCIHYRRLTGRIVGVWVTPDDGFGSIRLGQLGPVNVAWLATADTPAVLRRRAYALDRSTS